MVSILALILISLSMNALARSVKMQNSKAPITPNLENIQTINMISGIAIIEPTNAVLNNGNSECLHTRLIIPAIRGQIIKKAKAVLVSSNSFPMMFYFNMKG